MLLSAPQIRPFSRPLCVLQIYIIILLLLLLIIIIINNQLDRVQSILKIAACLIYGRAKYDHVTPILRDKLHWLRVPERIQYMCCLLVYKSLHGLAPSYISKFVQEFSCLTAARAYVQPPAVIINLSSQDQACLANDHLRFPARQSGTLFRTTSRQPHLLTLSKIAFKLICLVCRIRSAPDCFVKRLCAWTFPCLRRYINCHSYYYYYYYYYYDSTAGKVLIWSSIKSCASYGFLLGFLQDNPK